MNVSTTPVRGRQWGISCSLTDVPAWIYSSDRWTNMNLQFQQMYQHGEDDPTRAYIRFIASLEIFIFLHNPMQFYSSRLQQMSPLVNKRFITNKLMTTFLSHVYNMGERCGHQSLLYRTRNLYRKVTKLMLADYVMKNDIFNI